MSFASAVMAAAAVAGVANSMYQGKRGKDRAEAAADEQRKSLAEQEALREQDENRKNQKHADVGSLLQQNTGGFGGANLTGGYGGTGLLGGAGGGLLGR